MIIPTNNIVTIKDMISEVAEYLESNNLNFILAKFFDVNNGWLDEYRSLKELKKSFMLGSNASVILHTVRENCVYDEKEGAAMDALVVTYEIIDDF